MDVPFDVVMKDNGSIRTFGECLNKMQKPGKGGTVGSPGCSNICRKNKDSPKGKDKAKTEATKGSAGLYKYEPAQGNTRREGSVEGLIQE